MRRREKDFLHNARDNAEKRLLRKVFDKKSEKTIAKIFFLYI
jgi:hypothetical protein